VPCRGTAVSQRERAACKNANTRIGRPGAPTRCRPYQPVLVHADVHAQPVRMPRRLIAGILAGALVMLLIDATSVWRNRSCAEMDPPSCMHPPHWVWSSVRPMHVVLGALIGAALLLVLGAVAGRAERRRSWSRSMTPGSSDR
jgi:hypothetical protein